MSVAEQLVPAGDWQADGVLSSVRFEVAHMTVSMFSAGFSDVDATLVSERGGLELQGTVRVESFDARDDALRAQVLAPAFLDAERHPELSFRSTAIRADGDELSVAGELTIKGTTRAVEARGGIGRPVVDPYGNERLAMRLETVIDRTEFGIGWQMELPGGGFAVGNDVRLLVSLELVKDG
jgi:polyisoprenoid-binding protein YceI